MKSLRGTKEQENYNDCASGVKSLFMESFVLENQQH